jgi:hypothetical protein
LSINSLEIEIDCTFMKLKELNDLFCFRAMKKALLLYLILSHVHVLSRESLFFFFFLCVKIGNKTHWMGGKEHNEYKYIFLFVQF